MAYDGLFIKKQMEEIKDVILNEHIAKITMPSLKVIDFHIRKSGEDYIFRFNANPDFPHMLLDTSDTDNMKVPHAFCMLLRKYLQSAIIKDIYQIGKNSDENEFKDSGSIERIVKVTFENINEFGDIKNYYLFFEIMGRYSNVIVTDENYIVLDTLYKSNLADARITQKNKYSISSVANKNELSDTEFDQFCKLINNEKTVAEINKEQFDLSSAICKVFAGISKPYVISRIIDCLGDCFKNNSFSFSAFDKATLEMIQDETKFKALFEHLKEDTPYKPCINYKNDKPSDFYLYELNQYEGDKKYFDNLNVLITTFVEEKYSKLNDNVDKSQMKDIVQKLYSRLNKKLDIYKKDLAKCDDLDKYRKYGELISAFGYDKNLIKDGVLTCKDYNDNDKLVSIPIDESIPIPKNVEKYYNKYNKLKRTKENAEKLLDETNDKIEHLSSIKSSIEFCNDRNDLFLIKEELVNSYDEAKSISSLNAHNKLSKKRVDSKSKSKKIEYNIHHYKASSGIDIYVGKNNLQNEYLTFTMADSDDTWLHIKDATGSHVIVKKPYEKLDDKTLIEAASLAAYFSDKRNETKATVDYTLRKELKKVKGKAPGFCIYHKNYSINVKPEILIKEI